MGPIKYKFSTSDKIEKLSNYQNFWLSGFNFAKVSSDNWHSTIHSTL